MRLPLEHLLSLTRVLLAVIVAIEIDPGTRSVWVLPVVVLACATDIADGTIARARGSQGGVGRWLDAGADVAFLSVCFYCFAGIALWAPATGDVAPSVAYCLNLAPLVALVGSFGSFALRAGLAAALDRALEPSPLGRAAGALNYCLALVGAAAVVPGVEVGQELRMASTLIVVAVNALALLQNVVLLRRMLRHSD